MVSRDMEAVQDIVSKYQNMPDKPKKEGHEYQDKGQPQKSNLGGVLKDLGVPSRLNIGKASINPNQAIRRIDEWSNSDEWLLLINGPVGVGKSFAAAYWLMQANGNSKKGDQKNSWLRCGDLFMYEKKELREYWSRYRLVIDDLGVEYDSDSGYTSSIITSILNNRYDRRLKTIITTNLTMDDLGKKYDKRLYDRLKDDSAKPIGLTGKSYRGKPQPAPVQGELLGE